MKLKKINLLMSIIFTFVICITSVSAASDRLQIISSSGGNVEFEGLGGYFTKNIIASNTETGEITVEAKINNTKLTEIFFVIDNSTEIVAMSDVKSTINTASKTLVGNLHDNLSNIKTGLFVMHPYGTTPTDAANEGLISELSSSKTSTLAAFDTLLAASPIVNGQDFEEVLTAANNSFSENAENKIIILITSGIDATHIAEYKETLTTIGEEVTVITLVVNNSSPYVETMFGTEVAPATGILHDIDTGEITDTITGNVNSNITSTLPSNKYALLIEDVFPQSITDNFTIEYLGNPSQGVIGEFNNSERKFSWTVGDLINNSGIATFQYKLKLKNEVAAADVDKNLNVNAGVNIGFTGTESQLYECSPIIKILISNPKTGVYDYFIPASLIFCLSVLAISIIKRRDMFLPI